MDQAVDDGHSPRKTERRILITCIAIILTLLICRNLLVQIALGSHRGFGLSELIWPHDAELILLDQDIIQQDIDWEKHDPASVYTIASETHRLDPLDNWPFMLAGSLFERIGDTDKAITLFSKSVRLDPRSPAPRLHLIKNLIEAHRGDEALTQIIRLSRLRPDQNKLLFRALIVVLVRDPEHRLITRLNDYPDVRERFLDEASRTPEAEAFMAQLLNQPGIDKHVRWDQIDRVAQRGSNATAYAIWRRSPDANKSGNVFDPKFQGLDGPAAFRWQLTNNSGVVAGFTRENGVGPVALDIEVFADSTVNGTEQTVKIAPGSHRMTITGKAIDAPEIAGTMRWTVSCISDSQPLARIAFTITPKLVSRHADFTIPESGCDFQKITLNGIPETGSQPFRMRFSRITID